MDIPTKKLNIIQIVEFIISEYLLPLYILQQQHLPVSELLFHRQLDKTFVASEDHAFQSDPNETCFVRASRTQLFLE